MANHLTNVLEKVYSWDDDILGCGIVIAESLDDAKQKIAERLKDKILDSKQLDALQIWNWADCNFYSSEYPDALEIYKGKESLK